MMGRTHALLGALAAGALLPSASPDRLALWMALGAFGALLPDLDASESKIKRLSLGGITPFAPLSLALNRRFGHRGALHSLLGWGLASLLFLPLGLFLGLGVPVALSLGYGSHLVADACTKSGIPALYPHRERMHLLPRALRLTTGSLAEEALLVALGLLLFALLLSQLLLFVLPR